MLKRSAIRGAVIAASLAYGTIAFAAQPAPVPSPGDPVAKIDGDVIAIEEFEAALVRSARQRFYHGKVDEARLEDLKREVIEELVIERLLAREADRRAIKPDIADVEEKINELDARYKSSDQWAAQRDTVLPEMRARMMLNSRRAVLEETVKTVAAPSEAEIRRFYDANNDLFTEPRRDRLALILLKVDPSSTQDVWASAKDEADRIHNKIVTGKATFGDLAKLHSGDESAQSGGDMGYLHQGMLAPEAQTVVDDMKVGDLSEPLELLQGYALFQLLDRAEAKLRPYDQVRQRAMDLLIRKNGEEAWDKLIADLRKGTEIWFDPRIIAEKK